MEFTTKKERDEALIALQDEEPPKNNVDTWLDDNKKRTDEILNATITEAPAVPPQEPAVPLLDTVVPPVITETPVDEVITFKRSELPEILQPYKDGGEILKQAAHARDYANRSEEQLKAFEVENSQLKEAQRSMEERLKTVQAELETKISITPPSPGKRVAESQLEALQASIAELKNLDDSDYIEAGKVRKVLGNAALEIGNTVDSVNQLREEFKTLEDLKRETASLKTELHTYQSKAIERDKAAETDRYRESMKTGIEELQKEYPELKTSKPIMTEINDGLMHQNTVEYDVFKFGSRILSSKFNNNNPDWDSVNAVVNAYLRRDPGIIEYCAQNAITPESVGTIQGDVENYSILTNVDATMRGQKIDQYSGERKELVSPFNKNPVNYPNYLRAYEALKSESGITQKEIQNLIIEAEKRGQSALDEALGKKADIPKVLGEKGTGSPEDIGHEMGKETAANIIFARGEHIDFEENMDASAIKGDRRLFNLYNKALKTLGQPEAKPSAHWPPEKTA